MLREESPPASSSMSFGIMVEEPPVVAASASILSRVGAMMWPGRADPAPSAISPPGGDANPAPATPSDPGVHGAQGGMPVQRPLPRPPGCHGSAPPPPVVSGVATQPRLPRPSPSSSYGLGVRADIPTGSLPPPALGAASAPSHGVLQHLGSLGANEGGVGANQTQGYPGTGMAVVGGSGSMAPPPAPPLTPDMATGGAFAPPTQPFTSTGPPSGPPPTILASPQAPSHMPQLAVPLPLGPPATPPPPSMGPPAQGPLHVAVTDVDHPATKRLATVGAPSPPVSQQPVSQQPVSQESVALPPGSSLPEGWVAPPPPPLPSSVPTSASTLPPPPIASGHGDIAQGPIQQAAQTTDINGRSSAASAIASPPPPSKASAFPLSSLRKAHDYIKSRLTDAQLPQDTRLLECVLLAMTTDTRGLQGSGLSDAGSFDTQMAHLFKGIADRASGQDGFGSGGAMSGSDGVQYWAAHVYRTIASRGLTLGTRKEVLLATADELREAGMTKQAHALYLVAGLEPGHKAAKKRSFRLVGMSIEGGELSPQAFRDPALVDALRDSEVLDLLRHPVRDSQGPDERPDGMTIELLTYKLVYVAFLLDQGDVELAMAYLCAIHDMVWPWVKLADRNGGLKIKDGAPYQTDLLTRYATLVDRCKAMRASGPTAAAPPPRAPLAPLPTASAQRCPAPPSSTQRALSASSSDAAVARPAPPTPPPRSPGTANVWSPAKANPPPCPSAQGYGALDLSRSSGLTAEASDPLNTSYGGQAHAMAATQMQVQATGRYNQPSYDASTPAPANTEVASEGIMRRTLGWFGFGRSGASSPVESSTDVRGATPQYAAPLPRPYESTARGNMATLAAPVPQPPLPLAPPPTSGSGVASYYAPSCPQGFTGRRIEPAYAYSGHASPPSSNGSSSSRGYTNAYASNGSNVARPVYNI